MSQPFDTKIIANDEENQMLNESKTEDTKTQVKKWSLVIVFFFICLIVVILSYFLYVGLPLLNKSAS